MAIPPDMVANAPTMPTMAKPIIGWGNGKGQLAQPDEAEADGETTLRFDVDSNGDSVLLDRGNQRLLRPGKADVRLPTKDVLDVAIAKDGSFFALDGKAGVVSILSPDGKTNGGKLTIPSELAAHARSVVINDRDVYVESNRGELTRVGDVAGVVDPAPSMAPGRPTRDGRGFLTARMHDSEPGTLHIFMVERAPRKQRFSKLIHPTIEAEGIFLIDTNAKGTIYLGVTSSDRAQVLCLEPEHGGLLGVVELSIHIPEEAIVDAKALDGGGVIYSVETKQGVRLEQVDCK